MADVATTCISGNPQTSGQALTRVPNSRNFTIAPKINKQCPSARLDAKYDNRFNHRAYYQDQTGT